MSTEPILPDWRPANVATAAAPSDAHVPGLPDWLRELYPFQTRRLDVGGYRMSLVEEGAPDAPPLLLLHGSPGWSFAFRKLIPQVSARYRVLAPDMIGFGLSDKPSDPGYHTLARHIENLTGVIEELGLRRLTLLAHDWGGPIGLGYAAAHPENVSRIVVSNTWAFPMPNPKTLRLPRGVRLANRGGLLARCFAHSTTTPLPGTFAADERVTAGYIYPTESAAGDLAPRAFWRMLMPGSAATAELAQIQAGLGRITAPVEIVWGVQDAMLSRLPAYLLHDALKNAPAPTFVEQAAHCVAEDAPETLVAKLLTQRKPATKLKIIG